MLLTCFRRFLSMGNGNSLSCLTQQRLQEYMLLSYLKRGEIITLFKRFYELDPRKMNENFDHRFPCTQIAELFTNLKYNPFQDRLFHVFSSKRDGRFSFEDLLDLCSVLSENCPDAVKAKWAFRVFDFNDDKVIDKEDIVSIIEKLVSEHKITQSDTELIADILIRQIDIQGTGSINQMEFEHAVGKMSDFKHMFTCSI